MIYQCTVKWPGAAHDSRIFNTSGLRRIMETGTNIYRT